MTVGIPLIWTKPELAETITTVPLICMNPDDALTIGTLNPGALDQGFVAAVAVTDCTLDMVTMPLERLVALLRMTVGLLDNVTVPLDSDRIRLVTVTAVVGFVISISKPPELVTGA